MFSISPLASGNTVSEILLETLTLYSLEILKHYVSFLELFLNYSMLFTAIFLISLLSLKSFRLVAELLLLNLSKSLKTINSSESLTNSLKNWILEANLLGKI